MDKGQEGSYEEAYDVLPWLVGARFIEAVKGDEAIEDLVTPRSLETWREQELGRELAKQGSLTTMVRPHGGSRVELRLVIGHSPPAEIPHDGSYVAARIFVAFNERLGAWRVHAFQPPAMPSES